MNWEQRINRIILQDWMGNVISAKDVTADIIRNGETVTFKIGEVSLTDDGMIVPTNYTIHEEP